MKLFRAALFPASLLCAAFPSAGLASTESFETTVQPFLAKNCYGCHGAKLNLESYKNSQSMLQDRDRWDLVLSRIGSGIMPPRGAHQLEKADVTTVTTWIQTEFDRDDRSIKPVPGHVIADLTRVTTLVYSREASSHTYPEIGINDGHHPLSHHGGKKDSIEKLKKINAFHVGLFAYFLNKLKNTPDGDGSLLDHSMLVYGSSLSDGNKHLHNDLPILLAGGGSGTLKPGRHVIYEKDTPMTNLYLSMLDRMGVHAESLGDSTGQAPHLSDL